MLITELVRDLEKWDNFVDPLKEFRRMNRELFRTLYPSSSEFPPVNVFKNEEKAVVSAEIPGVEPEGFEISVTGKNLTIRFERKPDDLKEGESYTRKERWCGAFSRVIELPFSIETERVKATFNKGILHIELPRAAAERPRKIIVESE